MIEGLHHVALGVEDLDAAISFYEAAFAAEVVQQSAFEAVAQVDAAIGLKAAAARMAMLRLSNAHVELWEYRQPAPRDRRSDPNDLGYPHIALQVTDIEAEHKRLSGVGMQFVGPPVTFASGAKAIYGRDPFGNVIELYEPDAASAQI